MVNKFSLLEGSVLIYYLAQFQLLDSFGLFFSNTIGPAKFTGTAKANLNLGLKAYLNSGKMSLVFSGDVRANAKVEFSLQR